MDAEITRLGKAEMKAIARILVEQAELEAVRDDVIALQKLYYCFERGFPVKAWRSAINRAQNERCLLGQDSSKRPLVNREANRVTCRMRASRFLTWKGFWRTYSLCPRSAATWGFVVRTMICGITPPVSCQ